MPRIRSLKPDFFSSVTLGRCEMPARLLLLAMSCNADDAGRGDLDPRLARSWAFPLDEVPIGEVERWLDQLEAVGAIVRYTAEGRAYYAIPNFHAHQHPEKPRASTRPAPPDRAFPDRSPTVRGTLPGRSPTDSPTVLGAVGSLGSLVVEAGQSRQVSPVGGGARASADDPPSPPPAAPVDALLPDCPWSDLESHHAEAIRGALRAAQHPDSLAAEFRVLAHGGLRGGGPVPWWAIGQALHDLRLAGRRLTANALRGFVRSAMADAGAQRPPGSPDALQAMLAAARAEVAALTGSQEAA